MTISLGIDIGTNSVGSAWVDLDNREFSVGVGIFPAGVEESDSKRGAPVGQKRRNSRSQRRNLARRARRKRNLKAILIKSGLLPKKQTELEELLQITDPWKLRLKGLEDELTAYEFGRVLYHLGQRRGAIGVDADSEDPNAGKVKEAISNLDAAMKQFGSRTFGEFMARLREANTHETNEGKGAYSDAIRNRHDKFQFHATREQIHDEFKTLWNKQKSFCRDLANLLTNELEQQLDNPQVDGTWQYRGAIFGQRRFYWDVGTLGRCDLEPTERCCPVADRWASHYRVVESVNNIRIRERGGEWQSLSHDQHDAVISTLRNQKTASPASVRRALAIHTKDKKDFYHLNIENDTNRAINTDWFYREVVHGAIGEKRWLAIESNTQESINRALLKFDPSIDTHTKKLQKGAVEWWGLNEEQANKLFNAWQERPRLEKRLNLSRTAIRTCSLIWNHPQ